MAWITVTAPFSYPPLGTARWTRDYAEGQTENVPQACADYATGHGFATTARAPSGRGSEPVLPDYDPHAEPAEPEPSPEPPAPTT